MLRREPLSHSPARRKTRPAQSGNGKRLAARSLVGSGEQLERRKAMWSAARDEIREIVWLVCVVGSLSLMGVMLAAASAAVLS